MAISIFPSTAAEFVSNNFVVDMNDTSNNTADTGGVKQAGPYSMSFSSGDSSFDVYLIDEDGNSVGYSNTTSIVASGLFSTVVILGVAQDEVVSFLYQGSVNNADGEGDEPGAGAYLESISPSDLPSIDDTATVTGGNFASDVEITFESGATVLSAKNIVVNSSTELLVTRPDGLVEDDAPYDLKAVNPGVTPPTGTDAHILTDSVTAGSDPTWVTTSPLNVAVVGQAFSQTLEATDSDGTVTDYSVTGGTLTPGLTLDSSTGVLSGTATTPGNFVFTITATDDGGNETAKEFEQVGGAGLSGGTEVTDGGFEYHTFTSTDDLIAYEDTTVEYLIVAGGGAGGPIFGGNRPGGGGGAGGLLSGTATILAGTYTVTIGGGGSSTTSNNTAGSDSSIASIDTAIGGGQGGFEQTTGAPTSGGSGGGGADEAGASGTSGQGNAGGSGEFVDGSGGGGGAGASGANSSGESGGAGGDGLQFSTFATATGTGADSGYYAGGGGGGTAAAFAPGGLGGGGNAEKFRDSVPGDPNTGGGGSGGSESFENTSAGGSGGSGIVIVRYAI